MVSQTDTSSLGTEAPAPGTPIEDLATPALLLNGPACRRNLQKMADAARRGTCRLRPHFKNHKCPELARQQLEAGAAVGMTCAKLGEAEVLIERGFDDVLIANQVVGAAKMKRLAVLAGRAHVSVAVDADEQIDAISAAATSAGVTVGALIEVDGGMGRCGVQPGEPALKLARRITGLDGIELRGLQCFEGHCVYVDDLEERLNAARKCHEQAHRTRRLLVEHGLPGGVISGGSSATWQVAVGEETCDELQCGTYATMDWRYHELVPEFEIAMTILATVISRPRPGVAVLDLGIKGAGSEFGVPRVVGHPEIEIPFFLSEEHTTLNNAPDWKVGTQVQIMSSHACTTCNLYRRLVVHDQGRVTDVWPIEAAGRVE
ncbi:MAG: alanine racemase [Phycisphaeraceae bacterium]|nr:alanine racemase [Phycisphaeraceae bacterium]